MPSSTKHLPIVEASDDSAVPDEGAAEDNAADDEPTEVAATSESAGDETADNSNDIVLAAADTMVVPINSRFTEGQHYDRMTPTQPPSGSPEKSRSLKYLCGAVLIAQL